MDPVDIIRCNALVRKVWVKTRFTALGENTWTCSSLRVAADTPDVVDAPDEGEEAAAEAAGSATAASVGWIVADMRDSQPARFRVSCVSRICSCGDQLKLRLSHFFQ